MTDPAAPPPPTPIPPPDEHLDADVEAARLRQLHDDIEAVRERAHDDLEVGGEGRTFTDAGVAAQVEHEGDTEHPLADRP